MNKKILPLRGKIKTYSVNIRINPDMVDVYKTLGRGKIGPGIRNVLETYKKETIKAAYEAKKLL